MKKYNFRLVNRMYGYERDQLVCIGGNSLKEAQAKASKIDTFAEVIYLGEAERE